jgi:hypothetical protein
LHLRNKSNLDKKSDVNTAGECDTLVPEKQDTVKKYKKAVKTMKKVYFSLFLTIEKQQRRACNVESESLLSEILVREASPKDLPKFVQALPSAIVKISYEQALNVRNF